MNPLSQSPMPDWPAVFNTKTAIQYVGGRPNWDRLLERYSEHLTPISQFSKRRVWLRSKVDQALIMADMDETHIHNN